MFASAAILGFEGGQLMDAIIIEKFEWPVDWISFVFVMSNFALVGVIAVFYQKGTPKLIQNGYLVLISTILAWQFSMWPEWTTWIFCSMFAIYDLCAVLTPCGPLKCLIGLIQERQQPMPGLLYEANVRDGVGSNEAQQAAAPSRPPSSSSSRPPPSSSSRPPPQAPSSQAPNQSEEVADETIKLGLGDFIFYSVLVGRAALFDFTTFATAFLSIVMGLGGTLFLLSVLHKALPALPFSIFLATIYYFWARFTFIDYVDFVNGLPATV